MKGIHRIVLDGVERRLVFTTAAMAAYAEAIGNPSVRVVPQELGTFYAADGKMDDLTPEQQLAIIRVTEGWCRELVYMGLLGDALFKNKPLRESRDEVLELTMTVLSADLGAVFATYKQSGAVGELVAAGMKAIEAQQKDDQKKRLKTATKPKISLGKTLPITP